MPGQAGFPIVLQIGSVTVDAALEVTPAKQTTKVVSFTPLSGANAGEEQSVPGGQQFGSLTFKVVRTPLQAIQLRGIKEARSIEQCALSVPGGESEDFEAFISSYGDDALNDAGLMTSTIELKIASRPLASIPGYSV